MNKFIQTVKNKEHYLAFVVIVLAAISGIIPEAIARAEVKAATISKPTANPAIMNNEMQLTLAPDEGAEIKAEMRKGNKLQYTWSTNGGKANFDVHADSKKLNIDYHPYSKGSAQSKQGEIEAAFDGSHGWFWRNRTSNPITITLKTKGEYTNIKQVK
jgi:hypothetical protein